MHGEGSAREQKKRANATASFERNEAAMALRPRVCDYEWYTPRAHIEPAHRIHNARAEGQHGRVIGTYR
jgi:hypothetical protein